MKWLARLRRWFEGTPPQTILLCMRLDDMTVVHPEQITKTCSQCSAAVGVYPSGQAVLHECEHTRIICQRCGMADGGVLAPGAEFERFQSVPRP